MSPPPSRCSGTEPMDAKLFARIGAVAFVAIAITMSALQLREERVSAVPEVVDVTDPDSDP
ncbi:hypothetical protein ABTM70_20275, partial [Acinetobacter baumannii]